ncbi:MAG: dephospho-CoA kinase [Motiliproteus sp.]|jgi:dephospho-CoA kinase
MTFIVGLTGGIGSGKSTVANLFAERGIELIDTDLIAREIVAPGEPALQQILDHFGPGVLQLDGTLDRAALRPLVFSDPAQRHWLEQLTHPLIRQRTLQHLNQAASAYALLVSPLLLETDQHLLVDHILVIDLPEGLQIARTVQRDGNTQQQVRQILEAQCSRTKRLEHADSIIDNTQSPQALNKQIDSLDRQFRLLARAHKTQEKNP